MKKEEHQCVPQQAEWYSLLKKGAETLRVSLSEEQIRLFNLYWRELQEWNRYTNITAVSGLRDTIIKHFLDSLSVVENLPGSGRLADIGSGGGFPGIPIKIVRPGLSLVLIEAARKKANFLQQAVRTLGLQEIKVYHGRAESLCLREQFDCVVSRAFSSIEAFLKISTPVLTQEGIIIVMKGKAVARELQEAEREIKKGQLTIAGERHFQLPFQGGERTIVVFKRNVSRETMA
jgi:16S rRNA (guanine527-N7)-methyltransferase